MGLYEYALVGKTELKDSPLFFHLVNVFFIFIITTIIIIKNRFLTYLNRYISGLVPLLSPLEAFLLIIRRSPHSPSGLARPLY